MHRSWSGNPGYLDSVLIDDATLAGPDPNFLVDAGIDMITWSGQPVQLDPEITNLVPDPGPLAYRWSANPDEGVVFDSNSIEAPTVTIIYDPDANLGAGGGPLTILDPTAITVPNAGFEARPLNDGAVVHWRTNQNPNSWGYADPDGSQAGDGDASIYQWDPGLDVPIVGSWTWNRFGGIAPEGENIVAVDNYDSGLAQILAEVLSEFFRYSSIRTLSSSISSPVYGSHLRVRWFMRCSPWHWVQISFLPSSSFISE